MAQPSLSQRVLICALIPLLVFIVVVGVMLAIPAPSTAAPYFVVDTAVDAPDSDTGDGDCEISGGGCSLRAAIEQGTALGGATIVFSSTISGATITLSPTLGTLSLSAVASIMVNGEASDITVSGISLNAGTSIFTIEGNNNTIRGLIIRDAPEDGIRIGDFTGAAGGNGNIIELVKLIGNGVAGLHIHGGGFGGGQNNKIQESLIGTSNGSATFCVSGEENTYGVLVDAKPYGTTMIDNVIGCNLSHGIYITGTVGFPYDTLIKDNRIGISDNNGDIGNYGAGVTIENGAISVTIGTGNTISGNGADGIRIVGNGTSRITIKGNRIGTNNSGSASVFNNHPGIWVDSVSNAGVVIGPDNLVSGNAWAGIWIKASSYVTVTGNLIGTNITGTAEIPNGHDGIGITQGSQHISVGTNNTISGNTRDGIYISDSGTKDITIYGNHIGTNKNGTAPVGNHWRGIQVWNVPGAHTVIGPDNLISGNSWPGVYFGASSYVTATDNLIGTNTTGTAEIPNGAQGIVIDVGSQHISVGANNTISGNSWDGIFIGGSGTKDIKVYGNRIGTNKNGTAAVGNHLLGIKIWNVPGVHTVIGPDNLISGNSEKGVWLYSSTYVTLTHNLIGTNVTGTAEIPNGQSGVWIDHGSQHISVGTNNTISGNTWDGIFIGDSGTKDVKVYGNHIGTDKNGTAEVGNHTAGIKIWGVPGAYSVIGPDNLISGNDQAGVWLYSSTYVTLTHNLIGTNVTGTAVIKNGHDGVAVTDSSQFVTVGGSDLSDGNIISGNAWCGVRIRTGAMYNRLDYNLIGLSSTGDAAVGNGLGGICIHGGANKNIIGSSPYTVNSIGRPLAVGTQFISGNGYEGIWISGAHANFIGQVNAIGMATDGSPIGNRLQGIILHDAKDTTVMPNVVAYNGSAGIVVSTVVTPTGNKIRPYMIFGNGGLPIDLGDDGPTPNDPGDIDNGPNELLNYPVITASVGSPATIYGTVCLSCTVNIYQAIGNPAAAGGGGYYFDSVVASASGVFSATLPAGLTRAHVTLTACRWPCVNSGSTSEFSPRPVVYLPLIRR